MTVFTKYELVYCFFKKPIKCRGSDGFFHDAGKARGILIKSTHNDHQVWYHRVEDYIEWKEYLI